MSCRIESTGTSLPFDGLPLGSIQHAVAAARECLGISRHQTHEIDFLINAGVYRDEHISEPAMATFIQNELDLNTDLAGKTTFSLDLINGATGMLSAIEVIAAVIESGAAKVGLVVSSDANTDREPDPSYTYQPSGSAVLLDSSPEPGQGFSTFRFKTFNQYADLYQGIISYREKGGKCFIAKQEGLEEAYLDCSTQVFNELLQAEGISADDIDLLFPTQVSEPFLRNLPDKLGIPIEKVVNILPLIQDDTLTTSPFIAFDNAVKNGLLNTGSKVVFLTVGSGITVGTALYNF